MRSMVKKKAGYMFFGASLILGLLWFKHHATDVLPILL